MRNFSETWISLFHFPSNFKISVKSRIASYSWAFGGKFDAVVVCFPKNQWACVWKWTPVLALRYPFAEVSPNHFKHYDYYTHSRRWCRRFITELQNLGQCRHFTTVIPLMFIAYLFFFLWCRPQLLNCYTLSRICFHSATWEALESHTVVKPKYWDLTLI